MGEKYPGGLDAYGLLARGGVELRFVGIVFWNSIITGEKMAEPMV